MMIVPKPTDRKFNDILPANPLIEPTTGFWQELRRHEHHK